MSLPPPRKKLRGAELNAAELAAKQARVRATRLRYVAATAAVILTATALLDKASRAPQLTIPRIHRIAHCDPTTSEEYEKDIIMCKGAEAHNTALVKEALEGAQQGLLINNDVERWKSGGFVAGSTLAAAVIQYYTALAMRSEKLFLINKVVHDFMMHFFTTLACTKLIDHSECIGDNDEFGDTFKAPPFLCTEAVFVSPPQKELQRYNPTVLMLNLQRMAMLFCLFGSEFHEGTVTYLAVVSLETRKHDTHFRPTFGYDATQAYLLPDPRDQWFELMTTIWRTPRHIEPILATVAEKIIGNLNVMATKVPKEKATWNETFLESVRGYSPAGYYQATTTWNERIWDWAKDKFKVLVNENLLAASIKHSLYLTSILWLSLFVLEGYRNIVLRWYLAPIVFVISECVIYTAIFAWPGCPLFRLFPELSM